MKCQVKPRRYLRRGSLVATVPPLLLLLLAARTVGTQRMDPRIIGGQSTTLGAVGGYVVNLRYDGRFACGGTLVTNLFVVTAAHCVVDSVVERMAVQGGVTRLSESGVVRGVQRVMVPRSYNKQRGNMDVAVIKLQSPMSGPGIQTIPLCTSNWRVGATVRVSGWGVTSPLVDNYPVQLRTVQLQVITKRYCQYLYRRAADLMSSTFCAYAPGRDTCTGDSGGGIIYQNELCGIVSWGYGCAEPGYPGVYTSIHRSNRFITNALRK